MKYITLIIGLSVMGCLTPGEKVSGIYEQKRGKDDAETLATLVLLENGVHFVYKEGKSLKWEIKDKEIHAVNADGDIGVFRINPDDSLSKMATIDKDGKRKDLEKKEQLTLKKIK